LEDVNFARRVKANGFRLRMADGAGLINCRMYPDWPSVRDGFAKNILAGYGGSVIFLILAAFFHWLVFLGPWLWLFGFWTALSGVDLRFTTLDSSFTIHYSQFIPQGYPFGTIHNLLLLLIGLGLAVRMLTAVATRQRPGDALLMPLSVLLMTRIAAQAVWWHWHGGPRWKGRVVSIKL
jgi:chlorobactene glucosyltransferase